MMAECTVKLYMKAKTESDWEKIPCCNMEEYSIPLTSHEFFHGDDDTPTERRVCFTARWDLVCRFINNFKFKPYNDRLFIIAYNMTDGDCLCTSMEMLNGEYETPAVMRFKTACRDSISLSDIQSVFEEGNVNLSEVQKMYLAGFGGENFAFARQGMTNVDGVLIQGDTVMCCAENIGSHVTVPDGIRSIRQYAFSKTAIVKVKLPETLIEIGRSAFYDCRAIEEIILPPSVEKIGGAVFKECTALKKIKLPPFVKKLGDSAFYRCTKLKDIALPTSLESIGKKAFMGCWKLKEITFPPNLVSIGSNAFEGCSALEEITMPPSVKRVGSYAFCGCRSLNKITLSPTLASISGSVFRECRSMEKITLPPSLTSIGADAFWGCNALTEITIPPSVKRICGAAFSGCSALTEITIPPSVEKIGGRVFEWCNSLTRACLPAKAGLSKNIFLGCCSLEKLCLYGKPDNGMLIRGDIPKSVKSIEAPHVPYISFSKKLQKLASIGFAESYMRGDDVKDELKEDYFEAIRHRGNFSQYLDRPMMIRFLIHEKLIKLHQIDQMAEESGRSGNVEVTAMLMDYKHSAFSEEKIQKAELRKQKRSEKELEKILGL